MTHDYADFPYVDITVRVYNTAVHEFEDGSHGLLTLCMPGSDVSCKEEHHEIGSVLAGMGSCVVSIKQELCEHAQNVLGAGGYFQIKHSDIWEALQNALEKQKQDNVRLAERGLYNA